MLNPSYHSIGTSIESLIEVIYDIRLLNKNGLDKIGYQQAHEDHIAITTLFANSINKKFNHLLKDREEGKIEEKEYSRYLNRLKILMGADARMYAPELNMAKIEKAIKEIENTDRR